jgi:hypothetical protein
MANLGFIILSTDSNIGGLKNTIRSIQNTVDDYSVISIVNKSIKSDQMKEMQQYCDVYKGGNTITSLINKGFEKTKEEWNVVLMEGARVCKNLKLKYFKWITNEKNIIYPLIVDYNLNGYPNKIHNTFYNCTLNGICINKYFFKEIGKLSENPLEISRTFWAMQAKQKGAEFKCVLGVKIC